MRQSSLRYPMRRRVVPALAILLAAALLPAASVVTNAPEVERAAAPIIREAPDTESAVRAAVAQKTPVRVADMTTPTRLVDAQPDGTMTATLHAYPQRVSRDGRWVNIDTTLVRRPDGTVAPRAVEVDLVLSGGGAKTPLLRYGREGKSIALTWPGKLPEPVLSGATATYPEVLPGVDLRMRAEVDGYSQHLVVKDARAAKQPALRRIRLGLSTQDVKLTATRKGGLEARTAKGTVAFSAPPSRMWDSGAKSARVGVALTPASLTLTPDRALLRDPKARFPVIIDPAMNDPFRTGWTKVFSGYPEQEYWQGAPHIDADGWAKVGNCNWSWCNGIAITRSYFAFDTGFLAGKQIIWGTLSGTIVYGPSCNTRNHQLFMAVGGIDGGTNWNNAPQGWLVDTKGVEANYTGCVGNKGVGFNVAHALNGGGQSVYFIKAENEGDGYAWRKYDGFATTVRVNYNSRPNPPSSPGMDPPLKPACRWCAGVPYVGQENVTLQATLSDPDGDNLFPAWRVSSGGVETAWDGGAQANGTRHNAPINLKSRNGQQVGWWVHGVDGYWGSDATSGATFNVDLDPPGSKPGVSARIYQSDNRWHGGIGQPDQFTFTPTEPGKPGVRVNDIDHYLWGFENPPANKVDASSLGGPATVNIAPTDDGPKTLYVQSKDRAGHASPTQEYRIYVRAGNGPLAQWSLDGNAEDTAFLGDRDGTAQGVVRYAPGAVGSGLRLDGNGEVIAPNTVRTDGSFSVTAWAKLDRAEDQSYTVVSQHGQNTCAFCLQYQADKKAWVWVLPQADQATPPGWSYIQSPATAGEWVHLAGIHDAVEKKVKFYVDGRYIGAAAHDTPWHGGDVLRIGHGYTGGIDEVKVYDRALTAAEVTAEVSRDNVQLGHWKFDLPRRPEDADGTVVNAVPGGAAAVLHGGAKLASSPVNGALLLDSTDDYASTGTSVLRTDRSFTIGGWLRLDAAVPATHTATAVSQFGAVNSGFYLGYRNTDGGKWEFYLPSADTVTRPGDSAVTSGPNTAAVGGAPTHVMGVYDATTQKIEIFVNGKRAGSAARTGGFHATGELVMGRGFWQNAVSNPWNGSVDELRAYSRALSEAEIQGLVAQSGVTAGQWRLDGLDSTSRETPDSSTRGLTAKAEGGVDLVGGQTAYPDPSDMALQFNGSTGFASAPHAINTSRSFSASAWVRLEKVGGHYGVVSQDGDRASSFKIEADPGGGWSFTMFSQDVDGGGEAHRAIGGVAQVGAWTHLTGVYDADAGKLLLYVNGVLAATRDHTSAWDYPAGRLQIGRNKISGGPVDYFPGAIDDVAVYSRTLFAGEIRVMAGRDLSLAHNWALDESSGTGAADAVGARRATLSGGAGFAPGRVGNGVDFDGPGAVTTDGVDLRSDASFTVTAWAYLDSTDCDLDEVSECKADIVTVDGQNTSKFRLGHVINDGQSWRGAWTFEMPESDRVGAPTTKAVVTTEPADLNKWVHLAGVYDAAAGKFWLYVNGNRIGDGTLNTPWPHKGGVRIGQGKGDDGKPGEQWPGRVDDVRLYTGALDKDRVWSLFTSYPAERPAATLPAADLAHWKFDENAGTAVADASGKGRTATLKGGTGWNGGRSGFAGWLDGTSGYAETTGPVVDTGGSFSVAAWAQLTADAAVDRTVVAQDGRRVSTFLLQYNGAAKSWAVSVPEADADGAKMSVTLVAPIAPAVGEWTHLAMVYDAGLRQVRLYVNGFLAAAEVGVTMQPATGPMSIGRARWNGANSHFFPRGVDDVRAYSKALTNGEVRKVYEDAPVSNKVLYRFDEGNGKDSSWYANDLTISGGATLPPGLSGKMLQLDGVTGAGVSMGAPVSMRDSFAVSAWARLDRTDRQATVVGQDGARMSGFVLQYRPGLKRWVFGAPTQDADSAELAYVAAPTPAVAYRWTHLMGVYDHAARELRFYVDGQLAGVRSNVLLWRATGALSVGRGKFNGQPADFFQGGIDEVAVALGVPSDAAVARQAGWPAPAAGQLGRFVNGVGDHYAGDTTAPRDGYWFEGPLGLLVTGGQPNTRTLYACQAGRDAFTSRDAACENKTLVGEIGKVYAEPPSGVATTPVYRCAWPEDRFESRSSDCEGATNEDLLGYTVAYAQLNRYYYPLGPWDHVSTVHGGPPGHVAEGPAGWVSLVAQPGTVSLMSCQGNRDQFLSIDPLCEGSPVLHSNGRIWTSAPEGMPSRPIYRCLINGERYVSTNASCDGFTVDRQLGYVLTARPDAAGGAGS